MINDSLLNTGLMKYLKVSLVTLDPVQRRVLKVYGQCFYQQDLKNSILETEFMCESAAKGNSVHMVTVFSL